MTENIELPAPQHIGFAAQQAAEAERLRQEVEREQRKIALLDAMRASLNDPTLDLNDPSTVQDLAQSMYETAIREEARKRLEAAKSPAGFQSLNINGLDWWASQDLPEPVWRVQGFMQKGFNTSCSAQYKAGKTTLEVNLVKSVVDGTRFLGEYDVTPVDGNVVIFNYELSDEQFARWLLRRGIHNTHKVIPVNLRGKGHYLQDEAGQEWAIEILRQYDAEMWIVDPLQAALRGTVNDDSVASEWIAGAERVKAEAGVSDLFLVTHTGHQSAAMQRANQQQDNERSAGSARWMGWPDASWTYAKGVDETSGQELRFLSAKGREVEVDEFAVDFNADTWALTSRGKGSSRKDIKRNAPLTKLMSQWADNLDAHLIAGDISAAIGKTAWDSGRKAAMDSGYIVECDCDHRTSSRGAAPKGYRLTGYGREYLQQ